MNDGDILGHEPMGIVEEVGTDVTDLPVGDRVVIPFQISCGHCFMCDQQLYTQCETTQVREHGMGAALFGYTKLYGAGARRPGRVPAGAAGAVQPRSRCPTARLTSASSTSRTCCPRHGRRSSTRASPTAAPSRSWASGRSATMAARIASHQGPPGHRRRPRAGAARARACPRHRGAGPERARAGLADVDPRHDRRTRAGLRDRRRGHGGARLACGQDRAADRRDPARRGRREVDGEGRRRPPRRPLRGHRDRPPRRAPSR